MFYVDLYPPVYVQPNIVVEQYYPQPIYPAYPTVQIQRVIQSPYDTTIIDYTRERIYPDYELYRRW